MIISDEDKAAAKRIIDSGAITDSLASAFAVIRLASAPAALLFAGPVLAQGVDIPIDATVGRAPLATATSPGMGMGDETTIHVGPGGKFSVINPTGSQPPSSVSSMDCNVRDHGAVGNGTTDDTTAFQACVTALQPTSGGDLQVPGGSYLITQTLTLPTSITIRCASTGSTVLTSGSRDITLIDIAGGIYGGISRCLVVTNQAANASQPAVRVEQGVPVIIEHSYVWGGSWALITLGDDGLYFDNFFWGGNSSGGGVLSQGSNWWERDKFDNNGAPGNLAAFYVYTNSIGGTVYAENSFTDCDFSGTYQYSLMVNDPTLTAYSLFAGSTFSSPISITGARFTSFSHSKFGADINSPHAGIVSVVGSFGVNAVINATGALCAANGNVTC